MAFTWPTTQSRGSSLSLDLGWVTGERDSWAVSIYPSSGWAKYRDPVPLGNNIIPKQWSNFIWVPMVYWALKWHLSFLGHARCTFVEHLLLPGCYIREDYYYYWAPTVPIVLYNDNANNFLKSCYVLYTVTIFIIFKPDVSVAQFPYLYNRDHSAFLKGLAWGLNELIHTKHLMPWVYLGV